MHIHCTDIDCDRSHWTLFRLQREIRKLFLAKFGKGDEADQVLLPIAFAVYLLCKFFNGTKEALRANCVFRVSVREIMRRASKPVSDSYVAEARFALDLLRDYATEFGCFESTWTDRSPAYPSAYDDDDWMLWAPGFLRNPESHGSDHPWT